MAITYILIQNQTLTSNQTTVTFSAIPQTYDDLVLRISARSSRTADWIDELQIVPNNNSAANYTNTTLRGFANTTVSPATQTGQAYVRNIEMAAAGNATSQVFNNAEIYFPDYRNTSINRNFFHHTGVSYPQWPSAPTQSLVLMSSGFTQFTTAISSLVCTSATGNQIVTGSSLALYGIKRA
jgi:hypothetical protein